MDQTLRFGSSLTVRTIFFIFFIKKNYIKKFIFFFVFTKKQNFVYKKVL